MRSLIQVSNLTFAYDGSYDSIVISRMQIAELVLTFKPTILFVEHDKTFSDHIASKTVRL